MKKKRKKKEAWNEKSVFLAKKKNSKYNNPLSSKMKVNTRATELSVLWFTDQELELHRHPAHQLHTILVSIPLPSVVTSRKKHADGHWDIKIFII